MKTMENVNKGVNWINWLLIVVLCLFVIIIAFAFAKAIIVAMMTKITPEYFGYIILGPFIVFGIALRFYFQSEYKTTKSNLTLFGKKFSMTIALIGTILVMSMLTGLVDSTLGYQMFMSWLQVKV